MKALVIAPQPFFSPRGTPLSVYYRTLVTSELGVKVRKSRNMNTFSMEKIEYMSTGAQKSGDKTSNRCSSTTIIDYLK